LPRMEWLPRISTTGRVRYPALWPCWPASLGVSVVRAQPITRESSMSVSSVPQSDPRSGYIRLGYYSVWRTSDGDDVLSPYRRTRLGDAAVSRNLPHGENVAKALFRLLQRKAQDGEIRSVESMLPRDLHQLWPHTLQAA